MFQNKLTRAIFILMLLLIIIPGGYYYYSRGKSIFPTVPPTNDVIITYTSPYVISTVIVPTNTIQIRQSKTPNNDVITPYVELTTTSIPRSTPFDLNRFQEIAFINHTKIPIRVIITSPNYFNEIVEDVLYLDLVYALHWVYIFIDNNVYIEQIINDQFYYVNIFEDKIVVGIYKLQP